MAKIDFTTYTNIGPSLSDYLNAAGYTKKKFESTTPENIFIDCLVVIGPEKALKTCYPNMFCQAIYGAQQGVKWGDISAKEKKRFRDFGNEIKKSL